MPSLQTIWIYTQPFIKMLLIFIIGHYVIKYILRVLRKAFKRTTLDASFISIILKTANVLFHTIIVLSALSSIGVSTTGMLAALSAAGVAIAVALKDSLSNVAGGILLLISPRFATGDFIEVEEVKGTVVNVDLLHTTIKSFDNKLIYIPNGTLVNSHIINCTQAETRRLDITFCVPYNCDVELAKKIIYDTINSHPLALNEPALPLVRVSGYGESAVNIATKTWCKSENYWDLNYDIIESVRKKLNENGIEIPFNKLDVTIINQ